MIHLYRIKILKEVIERESVQKRSKFLTYHHHKRLKKFWDKWILGINEGTYTKYNAIKDCIVVIIFRNTKIEGSWMKLDFKNIIMLVWNHRGRWNISKQITLSIFHIYSIIALLLNKNFNKISINMEKKQNALITKMI